MSKMNIHLTVMGCLALATAARAALPPDLPTQFTFTLECRTTNSAAQKCGFGPYVSAGCCAPAARYYKQQETSDNIGLTRYSDGQCATAWWTGTYSDHTTWRKDPPGCQITNLVCGGSFNATNHLDTTPEPIAGERDCDGWVVNGNPVWNISCTDDYPIYFWHDAPPCDQGWWGYSPVTNSISCQEFYVTESYPDCTVVGDLGQSWIKGTNILHITLSSEYTTAELLSRLQNSLGDKAWTPSGGESPHAQASISDDQSAASAFVVEARFKVFCPPQEEFTINYTKCQQWFTNGVPTGITRTNVQINGTGTDGWQYITVSIPAPFTTYSSNGCTIYQGAAAWIEVGCAGASSCSSGNCARTPGTPTANLTDAGPLIQIGVGPSDHSAGASSLARTLSGSGAGSGTTGTTGGSLVVAATGPGASVTSPAGLELFGDFTGSEILRDNGTLRQVKGLLCLADIQLLSQTSYSVSFYTDYGWRNGGFYDTTGYTPFSTVTIAQGTSTNQLLVTVNNGDTRQYQYDWSDDGQTCTLTSGNGQRKESRTWAASLLVRTNTIKDASDQVIYQETKYYRDLSDYGRVLSQQVVGPSGPALTTQWFYYDNALTDGINYGRLKMVIQPSGFWQQYQYDSLGRLAQETSQFLNAATNASASQCRVVQYDYTSLDGTNDFETRAEQLLGTEIARQYTVNFPGETRLIRCALPGAAWTNAANLVTTTRYWLDGDFAGTVRSVSHPDGTLDLYYYEYSAPGQLNTTVLSGQPNGDQTDVVDGTETITTETTAPYGSLQRTVYDIQYPDCAIDNVYTTCDELDRPSTTQYADFTSSSITYDCCGIASTVDREGTTTIYLYDDLKRQVGTLRNGINTTNLLDAAGNVLRTVRVGTDGSAITNRTASFDAAGQLARETNALSGATVYSQSFDGNGQTVKTTTHPDGGTRVETYYQDGSLQKVTGTAAFPARYEHGVETDGGVLRGYNKEIKLDASGNDTGEWTKTYSDMFGRTYKTLSADTASSQSVYNNQGQLWKQVDPDGVTTLYQYNDKGEVEYTATDFYGDGQLHKDGTNRITRTVSDVLYDDNNGAYVRRTRNYVWPENGQDSPLLATSTETDVFSDHAWVTSAGLTTETQTTRGSGQRQTTTYAPDRSFTITTWQYGQLASAIRYDAYWSPIGQTTYGYDTLGRQIQVTDARNGTTSTTINNADLPATITTPSPDGSQPGQTTTFYYDRSLRATNTVQPDQASAFTQYEPHGLAAQTWGARTYPAGFGFDAQGRLGTMTNWSTFPTAGARVTTWNHDPYRGWVSGKSYAGGAAGPAYGYTPAGRLSTRAWARGVNTTYTTNSAGDLAAVAYDDGQTQGLTYGYDRRGRQSTTTQGGLTTTRTFDDAGNLLRESYSGGPLSGLSVTNGYDQYLRRTSLVLLSAQGAVLASTAYGYEAASRLQTISAGAISAGYAYLANSPLVGQIGFTNNGTQRMTTTKQWDFLNRLLSVSSAPSGASALSFAYGHNLANQRTNTTLGDGSQWTFANDSLGQVISGRKYWPDATPVAGQQFEYAFDDIGNRLSAAFGGNNAGQNLRTALYTNNSLSQVTSRDVPGFVPMRGSANSNATVSLWADSGAYAQTVRKGEYYSGEVLATNSSGPVWMTITNLAVLQNGTNADIVSSIVGSALVPATPEVFGYDLDGNMTNDGRWGFTWDAENRLTQIESRASVPSAAKRRLNFTYDAQWRRTQKIVYTNDGSGYVAQYTNRFVYDGWNLIAVLDSANNLLQSYIWGTDLSGTMQGAGGVGGLLAITDYRSGTAGTYFPAFDGNGNVVVLVNATDGGIAAQYEYGPFGEVIRATGPMAKANPFRFSTKYQDDETGLLYYGYRYYNASTGRWINRDPINEDGGLNLYGIADNDLASKYDFLGQCKCGVEQFNLIPRGWSIGGGKAFFTFDISIRFKKGNGYDCSCCRYIQWIKGDATVDGSHIDGGGGVPLDGQWHADANPYNDDDDTDPKGDIYRNRSGLPCDWVSTDTPGFRTDPIPAKTRLHVDFTFRGTVIDTCAGGATEVATSPDLHITLDGNYPKLKVSPSKRL